MRRSGKIIAVRRERCRLQSGRLRRVPVASLSDGGRRGVVGSPGERELVEVHVRRGNDFVGRGHPYVVSARR
eukprot:1314981-Pleurochrysis_carterae.AAC.1